MELWFHFISTLAMFWKVSECHEFPLRNWLPRKFKQDKWKPNPTPLHLLLLTSFTKGVCWHPLPLLVSFAVWCVPNTPWSSHGCSCEDSVMLLLLNLGWTLWSVMKHNLCIITCCCKCTQSFKMLSPPPCVWCRFTGSWWGALQIAVYSQERKE